eukprot:TRINITY_DN1094_c1_g1_i1.p1 TRINITY_DN1094_c1_g1~~TRINITY_DN1094_c1_g1_i1.p1  ORF type:complete len:104 (-),score=3.71 TRINITY_DN1094_c1_g1_i1:178-489(-)
MLLLLVLLKRMETITKKYSGRGKNKGMGAVNFFALVFFFSVFFFLTTFFTDNHRKGGWGSSKKIERSHHRGMVSFYSKHVSYIFEKISNLTPNLQKNSYSTPF